MRVVLLIIAICSCFGHPCFRAMKSYVAECEIPNTVDSDYCKNKRQEVINGGCEQIVKDFDICKGDLKKLCSPDNENPRGCFGRCLVNKIPQLSSECANTETVKRIIERVKSGRFPGAPENGNGNDSPQAPNGEQPPPPPPPNGDLPPPPPNGEQPPPPPNGELPQQPPNGELPRPTLDGELPPPAKGDEPSIEVRTGSSEQEIRHSEYQLKGGMRHRGWNRFHKRCGWKTKFVMFVVVSLLFTIGLCWTIRERQRRAFLRRSRVTTPKLPGSWSTGLFGSWDQITPDWKTCLPSFLFPCFQNALNQSELQDRDCTFADFFFNICHWQRHSNTYRDRQEIRARHNIPEDSCGDCLASVFCSPCAIAQNAREIDIRTCAQGGTYWPAQKLPDTWVPAKTDII